MTAKDFEVATTAHALTVSSTEASEAGKGGEGGEIQITNSEFIGSIFSDLPEGAYAAASTKTGDPTRGGWVANRADLDVVSLSVDANNFINCSSFYPSDDGLFKARKDHFAACHFLMLDDLGTKAALSRLDGFELSWLIETSPGNHQGGIMLAEAITDGPLVSRSGMVETPRL